MVLLVPVVPSLGADVEGGVSSLGGAGGGGGVRLGAVSGWPGVAAVTWVILVLPARS